MTKYYFLLLCLLLFKNASTQNEKIEVVDFEQVEEIGRIWGYLKYYDPTISQGETNWDSVLIKKLPLFYQKQSRNVFNKKIRNHFLNPQEKTDTIQADLEAIDWIKNSLLLDSININSLKNKPSTIPQSKFYVKVNETSKNVILTNEKRYKNISFPNKEYQLLTLFKYWNVIKYFYPYKKLMDKNWDKILGEYLPKFYYCSNENQFHKLVSQLTTELSDTHVQTGSDILSIATGYYFVKFKIESFNDNYFVTGFINDEISKESPLRIGDIILEKEGMSVSKIDSTHRIIFRASNKPTTDKYIAEYLLIGTTDSVSLKIKRNKDTLICKVPRILRLDRQSLIDKKRSLSPFKSLNKDIAYLNLGALYNLQIDSLFNNHIKGKKGLIIDLREYPNETYYKLCSKLIKEDSVVFVKINAPNINKLGDFSNEFTLYVNGDSTNYFKGSVVLLINENTQSQGEFSAMALELAPDVIKIGSQTAGADGNVSQVYLPFGITTSFSGLAITYPDGTQTQRIGIKPDIEVKRTLQDIIKGEDTLLNFAIKYLKEKN